MTRAEPVEMSLDAAVRASSGDDLACFGLREEDFAQLLWPGCRVHPVTLLRNSTHRSLEQRTGLRVNPDLYDIDEDHRPVAAQVIADACDLGASMPLLAYRPTWRLDRAARDAGVQLLTMPVDVQRRVEGRALVEEALRSRDLPTVGWFSLDAPPRHTAGPLVVRTVGHGGGAGMALASDLDAARSLPGAHTASRYIDGATSLNLSGCCYCDGTVSVHLPTVQLIGVDHCTSLPFGYCGNDAASVATVSTTALLRAREMVVEVGRWLRDEAGWVGTFGIDLLARDDDIWFCELNPRFQGSTRVTAAAGRSEGRPGLIVEHLAAMLGMTPDPTAELGTTDAAGHAEAQVVVHNLADRAVRLRADLVAPPGWQLEVRPDPETCIEPGAPLARLRTIGPITADGSALTPAAAAAVRSVQAGVIR